MQYLNKFIRFSIALLLVLTILYVASLVGFVFNPVKSLFSVILIPLLISGFFYYLLRPLVGMLEKRKVNRSIAVLLIYVSIGIVVVGFTIGVWPLLRIQLINLVDSAPHLFNDLSAQLEVMEQNRFLSNILPADFFGPLSNVSEYLSKGFIFLTNYVSGLVSFVSNFTIVMFTFPIMLYYMLKEGEKFEKLAVAIFPRRYHKEAEKAAGEIDSALSNYIVSRVFVNLVLGALMYLGFLSIGLPYALLLSVMAVILNFIPLFGAILSAVPIVLIGLIESPSIGIWSLVIILLAQQIQDNVVSPYVFGKKLDIHPITTIVLVLAGGDLFGIIGVLIIIPVYMVLKILAQRVYPLFIKKHWDEL